MIQGCSSSAGKSLLVTALARLFARRGIRVAPFKGLNMSNNARVVDGSEIASAQYFQALAAGVQPDVRMNPLLVKPEADGKSQVVVLGRVDHHLSRTPWRERTAPLWPHVENAFRSLAAEYDLILIEGAGSPAEVNLWDTDVANMRVADLADASVQLVVDIDRGGAFAHLYGTWALLPERHRARIRGFVLNKFRGDAALLEPGSEQLEAMTGTPTVAVIPMLGHHLPDEDGAAPVTVSPEIGAGSVAVIRYPTASNLDEFEPVKAVGRLRWAWHPADLVDAALVVLPGSKNVAGDLAWMHSHGFDRAIVERIERGDRVLAICGGLQILGERLDDEAGVDADAAGLGVLPLKTTFLSDKITRRAAGRFRQLPEPWRDLSGLRFTGYEIHHGTSAKTARLDEAIDNDLGFVHGPVLAVYAHGILEEPQVLHALVGVSAGADLEATFNQLADAVEAGLKVALP